MATIVTIAAGDAITNSRTDLNTNFANLNSDKIETSVIDTDTSLSADSDARIPSQKAVKAYVDSGGNASASTTVRGIVEQATASEINSGSEFGGTGAPLFINPSTISGTKLSRFGGTGADGALAITSGTTTIDLGGLARVVKNYTSISITGTGQLDFTNPHASGTYVILKSQGNVIITSSATAISLVGIGADRANNGKVLVGTNPGVGTTGGVSGGAGGTAGNAGQTDYLYPKWIPFVVGAAGGDGSSGPGLGGRGGGALYIECGGAYTFTTGTITVAGAPGTLVGNTSGGGGGAGSIVVLYTSLTASSGTYTVTGGAGQNGLGNNGGGGGGSLTAGTNGGTGSGNGGTGGTGFSLIAANTEFV